MQNRDDVRNTINKYQKKQQGGGRMFAFGAIALVLFFVGLIFIYQWITNPNAPMFSFLSTETPTPTVTITPTPTVPTPTPVPPTETPTATETPTITLTPTIDGPFFYTIKAGDTLFGIAQQFGVDINRLLEVNNLTFDSFIVEGQQILVPDPNEELPTATPIPAGLPRGTEIEYTVQLGDNLTTIAAKFNSTAEAILEANEEIESLNDIFVGQVIIVPVNLVTPAPTSTGAPLGTPGAISTLTPVPTQPAETPTPTP